jgi:hypothetical protein
MMVLQSSTQTKWATVSLLFLYSDLKKLFVHLNTTKSALRQYFSFWHTEFTGLQNNYQVPIKNADVLNPVASVYKVSIQISQPTRCNNFTSLLLDVLVWLNMFRAPTRPS